MKLKRLQKVIAESGIASRRKAEELIKHGCVKVNGEVVTELGIKVSDKDKVQVNNKPVIKEEKEYYLLNKPRGIITSTTDDKNRKTVIDLIPTTVRIYPVGRLDYDTTGVLLLTNDGEFANILMHPKNKIDKVYMVKLKGIIAPADIKRLKDGIELEPGLTVNADRLKLKKIDSKTNTCMVQIMIHEGKNHQVKRMFEKVGYEVLKLKREKVAHFDLKNLKSGEFRKLTVKEVAKVYGMNHNN